MSDTITNLIADIRNWEKNAKTNSVDPNLAEICSGLVPVLDSIATRLEQLVKDGLYVTPGSINKFLKEELKADVPPDEQPIDPSAPTLNQILKNPPFEIYRYSQMKSMPRGIEMKEFVHADGSITFVGQYFNKKNAQPNSRPKRVYRAEICAFGASDWRASLWEDDDLLAKVVGSNKWNVAYAALGALRGILHKRCVAVRGNRRRRAAAAAATNH